MVKKSSQIYAHLGFLIILTGLFCLSCIKGKTPYEMTNKQVDKIISENQLYKEINDLCTQLPLPDDFNLIGKVGLFNLKAISYKYNSKYDFEYVENFYKDYFSQKGWNFSDTDTLTKGVKFSSDLYEITIYSLGENPDYSMNCFKKADVIENK